MTGWLIKTDTTTSMSSGKVSLHDMEMLVQRLLNQQHRSSTAKKYLRIWRQFNAFILKLDFMPKFWEDRTTLFLTDLVEK